jgi:hypothetical protein
MKNTKIKSLAMITAALFGVANFNTAFAKSKPADEKVKDWIDDVSESFKKGVDNLKHDVVAIQDYLDNYHWKGVVQDEATSDAVTLKHLKLNGHSRAVVVKKGERIECSVKCDLDREKCSALSLYRVVIGLKGQGAQTTIGNELGIVAGESKEKFTLIAPREAGVYQIRFRLVERLLEGSALNAWEKHGKEPDGTTTIGVIVVEA